MLCTRLATMKRFFTQQSLYLKTLKSSSTNCRACIIVILNSGSVRKRTYSYWQQSCTIDSSVLNALQRPVSKRPYHKRYSKRNFSRGRGNRRGRGRRGRGRGRRGRGRRGRGRGDKFQNANNRDPTPQTDNTQENGY